MGGDMITADLASILGIESPPNEGPVEKPIEGVAAGLDSGEVGIVTCLPPTTCIRRGLGIISLRYVEGLFPHSRKGWGTQTILMHGYPNPFRG